MYARETTVNNKTGLHARPAADFVVKAKEFSAKITIRKIDGGEPVNAKSMVRLLTEGISQGTRVELAADGPDETAAVDALIALIESGFGE